MPHGNLPAHSSTCNTAIAQQPDQPVPLMPHSNLPAILLSLTQLTQNIHVNRFRWIPL